MIYLRIFRVAGSLTNFITGINQQGGFSYSNNYDVEFNFGSETDDLKNLFKEYGIDFTTAGPTSSGGILKLMCDEAQLPNVQAATGQITGRYLGEGLVNYPHTKIYNDFQLSFLGDANLLSLKFLNLWYGYIFREYQNGPNPLAAGNFDGQTLGVIKSDAAGKNVSRHIRLSYPESYLCNLTITKTDRTKTAPNGRAPISYTMIDAYPYSIDAVPMSYGASQIVKVTANFYYAKHSVVYNNIRNVE